MQTVNYAVNAKLESYFEHGFLSGEPLMEVRKTLKEKGAETGLSADSGVPAAVYLNCISKIQGIRTSLFHGSKGGFNVALEGKIGTNALIDEFLDWKQIEQDIEQWKQENPSYPSYAAPGVVINNVLSTNPEFAKRVEEKVQKTALFILQNMDIQTDENNAIDGCKETNRKFISKDHIRLVIVSEEYKDAITSDKIPADKVRYVPFHEDKFNEINYVDDEKKRTISIKPKIPIKFPDYESVLKEIAEEIIKNSSLQEQPIYTHMTRI